MDDLIERLHALSRYEHSDYSIGDEAATEIEALRAEVEQMTNMARMQAARADATERGARHHKTRAERLAETLREMREYVTAALQAEREAFTGHEDCSDIPGIEADLHKIDSALNPTAAQEKDDA